MWEEVGGGTTNCGRTADRKEELHSIDNEKIVASGHSEERRMANPSRKKYSLIGKTRSL
jgi:hypothetical protein